MVAGPSVLHRQGRFLARHDCVNQGVQRLILLQDLSGFLSFTSSLGFSWLGLRRRKRAGYTREANTRPR